MGDSGGGKRKEWEVTHTQLTHTPPARDIREKFRGKTIVFSLAPEPYSLIIIIICVCLSVCLQLVCVCVCAPFPLNSSSCNYSAAITEWTGNGVRIAAAAKGNGCFHLSKTSQPPLSTDFLLG